MERSKIKSLQNIQQLIESKSKELESLPLGSIQRKRINFQEYYYRVWRERGTKKLKYQTLGTVTTEKAQEFAKEKQLKEGLREELRQLKKDKSCLEKEIKKAQKLQKID